MLVECSISNLAVIESVHVRFSEGFHVLTGETGAGKSMIIDALSLIIGGRGSADLVRHGAAKAEIECLFELKKDHPVWQVLQKYGFDGSDENQLLLRREISAQGKSSSRVNGRMANITLLKEIGEHLVNIHGQHEHQSLLNTDRHLEWLDLYGGDQIEALNESYRTLYKEYQALKQELNELRNSGQQMLQMIDLYRFQVEEIAAAALTDGEEDVLLEEKRKLANAEKLFESISSSYEFFNSSGLTGFADAMKKIEEAVHFDKAGLGSIFEQLQNAYYQMEDAAFELRDYLDQIEFNPERLQEIEERLDLIAHLRRKYGNNIEEILQYAEKIQKELDVMENKDDKILELQNRADDLHNVLDKAARQLTDLRLAAAEQLAEQIELELSALHMEKSKFKVQLQTNREKLTSTGYDKAEFLISANPGEPLRPLHKIASGGEISRIMLALKSIFASIDQIPVLVFDEVDTGVSGRAAQSIAEKLSDLSRHCQVFSITHLPQVACMADVHFEIRKETTNERTYTRVEHLKANMRVRELARMLGGVEVTETTEHHAKEMLDMAEYKKEKRNHFQ